MLAIIERLFTVDCAFFIKCLEVATAFELCGVQFKRRLVE